MTSSWKAEAGGLQTPETKDLPINDATALLTVAPTTAYTRKARRIAGGRSHSFLGQVKRTISLENISKETMTAEGSPGMLPGLTAERTTASEAGQMTGLAGRRPKRLPPRRTTNLAQLVKGPGQVSRTISLQNLSKKIFTAEGAPRVLPGLTAEQITASEAGQTTGLAGRRPKRLPPRRTTNLAQLVTGRLGNLIPSADNKNREIRTLSENLAVLRAAVTIMFPPARRRMVLKLKGLFAADKMPGITRLLLPLAWRVSRTTFQSYRVP